MEITAREPRAELELEQLAECVRVEHKLVTALAGEMVAAAVRAGELLIEAKRRLRHGEFAPWLAYCGVNSRTARVYMRLARNRQHAAVLQADSIRAALEALAGPPPAKPKPVDLGLPRRSTYAWDESWQVAAWREAMWAEDRCVGLVVGANRFASGGMSENLHYTTEPGFFSRDGAAE